MGRKKVEQRTFHYSCIYCDYNVTSEKALSLHLKYSHNLKPSKKVDESYHWGCICCRKFKCKHYNP